MSFAACVDRNVQRYASRRPLRAASVIITLFGDAIVPRGGQVWLGSVIRLLKPLGLSERLVRTSVSRLVAEGWLEAVPQGRRSDYRLTGEGSRRFSAATRRIYGEPNSDWDGSWFLVFLTDQTSEARQRLRAELGWLGFGALSPGVFAHPAPDGEELAELFDDEGVEPLTMRGVALPDAAPGALKDIVAKQWSLDELAQGYVTFRQNYQELSTALGRARSLPGEACFQARLLLIHEYRRLLLRDPDLPPEVLQSDWPGKSARALVARMYTRLAPPADRWLSSRLENHDGPLPAPSAEHDRRFKGKNVKSPKPKKRVRYA